MKKIGLICAAVLVCSSLSACGSQSAKSKSSSSEISSLKKENSQLKHKHHKKQNKKKQSPNSSASSNSNSRNQQQTSQRNNNQQPTHQSNGNGQPYSNGVNKADDAVAAAQAKYGNDNGSVQWHYMIDGETGQPIRNADGSYFVKGTDGQTMSGTRYSVNVYPDGSMTSN